MTTVTNAYDTVVVGGGAAGVFAAIAVVQARPGSRVVILEATPALLSKVKISGGGRCNVTHDCLVPRELLDYYPRTHRKLEGAFRVFGPAETIAWFAENGVKLKTEPDGRLFPTTDDSQTIIDCLRQALRRGNVAIHTNTPVKGIARTSAGYTLTLATPQETQLTTRTLVLGTGGNRRGYPLAQQLGHTLVSPAPSLFTFELPKDASYRELSGLSVPNVTSTLTFPPGFKVDGKSAKPIQQSGPLLFTHWGLSGPCILRLSAWGARALHAANYHASLAVDVFPATSEEALRQSLLALKASDIADRQIKNEPIEGIPKRLWAVMLTEHGINPETCWREVPNKLLNTFAQALKRWPFMVVGKGPFKEEFVTAGGVPLNEVNLATFESKVAPGVALVGELLNVDGVTGGFNFQHAWTSGYLAGQRLAELLSAAE